MQIDARKLMLILTVAQLTYESPISILEDDVSISGVYDPANNLSAQRLLELKDLILDADDVRIFRKFVPAGSEPHR